MNLTTKLQPVWILAAAMAGLALGQKTAAGEQASRLIAVFLMALLFMVFLSVDLKSLGKSFFNYRFTLASLLVNFLWTPIFAVLLAAVFLREMQDLQIGFFMLLATPCTDWYLVFTGLARGNTALAAAILPLNLLLQLLLLPAYLLIFYGSGAGIGGAEIAGSILLVLAVPFGLAQILKLAAGKYSAVGKGIGFLKRRSEGLQLIFLCAAVAAMFASEGGVLFENPLLPLRMLPPLACFFTINFLLGCLAGKVLKIPFFDTVPLIMTTLARNSPLALAIAVTAFPDRPLIALALAVGPLIELPVLGLVSGILLKTGNRNGDGNSGKEALEEGRG